jgi:multidrug efflux pump subunit AcrA (membrane-fusion protein)
MAAHGSIDTPAIDSITDTLPMPASFAQMSRVPQHPHRRSDGAVVVLLVIALTFPFFAVGRTPPATHDLDAAQAAILRADSADADQYAPDALLRAKNALSQAQAALAARKTADAIGLAQLSAAEADDAHARSREAIQRSELSRRRAEIAELRRRLGMETPP